MRRPLILRFVLVLLAAVAMWQCGQDNSQPRSDAKAPAREENHYSPQENLERVDLALIDSARQSLDIAMYAFTDRYLAEAVVRAARRGVQVRIYRDRQQFEDEQRKAGARGSGSTSDMFQGVPNLQLRVKSSRELMHLKAYVVDHSLLRDGSANWSPSGLKRQDNNLRLTTDASQVAAFERQYSEMWNRDDQSHT